MSEDNAAVRLGAPARRAPAVPDAEAPPHAVVGLNSLPVVEAVDVSRSFGETLALDGVTLTVQPGETHALLGPNGAGKTTLLRTLSGVILPSAGSVSIAGHDTARNPRVVRGMVGLVPSGDRSFYLRISGLENLVFFGRMYGYRRKEALRRAHSVLERVGLEDVSRARVNTYSHGMQKRLSMARALLTDPVIMLVDEATHDLDPEGAQRIRSEVRGLADSGTAVVWATQRLDEIRGFADSVTLLNRGTVQFGGSVPELIAKSSARRYLLTMGGGPHGVALDTAAQNAVGKLGLVLLVGDDSGRHFILSLADGAVLGDALAALTGAGIEIHHCHSERSDIEEAFLSLTREPLE